MILQHYQVHKYNEVGKQKRYKNCMRIVKYTHIVQNYIHYHGKKGYPSSNRPEILV